MVRKKKTWRDLLTAKVAQSSAVVLLIGAIATGIWNIEGRFARAADTDKKFEAVQDTLREQQRTLNRAFARYERVVLEAQKRVLQREQFDLIAIQEKRRLTDLEIKRLQAVTEDIGKLDADIKALVDKEREVMPNK